MIRVVPQPEPADFDEKVRQKGKAYYLENNKIKNYWTKSLDDLHTKYQGICAYLCLSIHRTTGSKTVDHFLPKSKYPQLAYEWSNYRLACGKMNSNKGDYEDVLDPFEVQDDWFHLEFFQGTIYPNPHLEAEIIDKIKKTIERLKLNEPKFKEDRLSGFEFYKEKHDEDLFKKTSPFVWKEAKRQGLL